MRKLQLSDTVYEYLFNVVIRYYLEQSFTLVCQSTSSDYEINLNDETDIILTHDQSVFRLLFRSKNTKRTSVIGIFDLENPVDVIKKVNDYVRSCVNIDHKWKQYLEKLENE